MKLTSYLFATMVCCAMSLFLLPQTGLSQAMELDTVQVEEWSPIATDRPRITQTAILVPRGHFQMEHGFQIEDADGDYIYTTPSSLWKYGLTDNLELRVTTEYSFIDRLEGPDLRGFQPFSVGLKAKLSEQKGFLPKMSFIGHLVLPGLTDETLRTQYIAPQVRLAFLHSVSQLYSLSYNAGLEWNGSSPEPSFVYSLSNNFNILKRLGLFVEVYGDSQQRSDDKVRLRADAGLTYILGNNFQLDVSGGLGLTENAPERFISCGFSYRFKV